jgi:hypothetical protein
VRLVDRLLVLAVIDKSLSRSRMRRRHEIAISRKCRCRQRSATRRKEAHTMYVRNKPDAIIDISLPGSVLYRVARRWNRLSFIAAQHADVEHFNA